MAQFTIYTDARGEYRWRLKANNGRIVADSAEGYSSKQGAQNDANWVKVNGPSAPVQS